MSSEVEIARFHHGDPLALARKALEEAGIPFRCSDDSLTPDVSALGRGANASSILLVPEKQVVAARMALFHAARKEVAAAPDEEHFLKSSTDQDLLEMIASPQDWSEYDLALAEHFLRQRNITPPDIDFAKLVAAAAPVATTEPSARVGEELPPGNKEVSGTMLIGGFLFGSMAGIWGFIISLAILLSTEVGPDGRKRYFYSHRSRKWGAVLLLYAFAVFWAAFLYLTFYQR